MSGAVTLNKRGAPDWIEHEINHPDFPGCSLVCWLPRRTRVDSDIVLLLARSLLSRYFRVGRLQPLQRRACPWCKETDSVISKGRNSAGVRTWHCKRCRRGFTTNVALGIVSDRDKPALYRGRFVELVWEHRRPLDDVAEELSIHWATARRWYRQMLAEGKPELECHCGQHLLHKYKPCKRITGSKG
jgi:transposase-like protein